MNATQSHPTPRFVYDRCYVEPGIQLRVPEAPGPSGPGILQLLSEALTYRPTGTRTAAGFYEYELVEESLPE